MEEERLDKLLIERGLVTSRVHAEKIIRESGVLVNGKLFTKTGKKVPVDAKLELLEEEIPWVSRGALKLIAALDKWPLSVEGNTFIDLGASTGGFSEVLLSKGVQKVYCVDVGKDQLHASLKNDPRIINLERTHVRELNQNIIPEPVDGIVIDVSFISLSKVLPFLHPHIKAGGKVIVLVKPQFEVGKDNLAKGGIVKNQALFPEVIQNIKNCANENNFKYIDHIDSPILGGDGNREFLMLLERNSGH